MKRLQNKNYPGSTFSYLPKTLQATYLPGMKHKNWTYFMANPAAFNLIILNRLDYVNLPTLDVYEAKANTKDGIVVGYVMDSTVKTVLYAHNYLVACNNEFRMSGLRDLDKNRFNMKHRFNGMNLYEYSGMASMVTLGLPDKLCESMELT